MDLLGGGIDRLPSFFSFFPEGEGEGGSGVDLDTI